MLEVRMKVCECVGCIGLHRIGMNEWMLINNLTFYKHVSIKPVNQHKKRWMGINRDRLIESTYRLTNETIE